MRFFIVLKSHWVLFVFNPRRCANIVLTLSVKESRQIINLNRAHVYVFARVYIQAAAESHRKCRGAPGAIGKTCADMLDAEQSFDKRGHTFGAPVVARTDQ